MSVVEINLFPSPAVLLDSVVGIRTIVHTDTKAMTIKTCPNGTPGLIFQFGEDRGCIESITTRSSKVQDVPVLFLHGLRPEPSVMKFRPGPYTTLQVVLKPNALYCLFGMDAFTLSQRLLPAEEFGAKVLQKQLVSETNLESRVALLEDFLLEQHKLHHNKDEVVERALGLIQAQIRTVTVKILVDQLDISERQLQKHFLRVVGCSPQQYIRMRRVNEALRLIRGGHYERLSDVAYELQYYDQSHFIRDIKALSWLTPKSFAQSVSEFRQDESGISYV